MSNISDNSITQLVHPKDARFFYCCSTFYHVSKTRNANNRNTGTLPNFIVSDIKKGEKKEERKRQAPRSTQRNMWKVEESKKLSFRKDQDHMFSRLSCLPLLQHKIDRIWLYNLYILLYHINALVCEKRYSGRGVKNNVSTLFLLFFLLAPFLCIFFISFFSQDR